MKLGTLVLKGNALLSPLEGVSCVGFRSLCFQQGAALTFTEMVRAAAVARENAATLQLIDTYDENSLTGLQILAKSPKEMIDALTTVEKLSMEPAWKHFTNIKVIDLNFGCPSPEIIRIGAGPAMLKRQTRLLEMFKCLVEWKNSTNLAIGAVGCKIRLGLNSVEQDLKIYLKVIDAANFAQLDYVTVHARHAQQRSRDTPTWSCIQEIKSIATMPIIGNGDIFSLRDGRNMFEASGCDGYMLARAAIRNPWVFNDFARQQFHTHGNQNDTCIYEERWPTRSEVEDSRDKYLKLALQCGTKDKFVSFHRSNFARLHQAVLSGNKQLAVASPKTAHLS